MRKQFHIPDSDSSEEFLPSEEDSDAVVVNIPEVCLGKEEEDGSNDFCEVTPRNPGNTPSTYCQGPILYHFRHARWEESYFAAIRVLLFSTFPAAGQN